MKTMIALQRVVLICAAVWLCGGAVRADELKTWRHGIVEARSDAGFNLMSSRRGFAEREGLKVDILQVKADTVGLEALLAGALDSYDGGPVGAIAAAVRGADLKIIGCHWPGIVHGIFARSSIAAVPDIKGKNIASSAPGSLPDLLAHAVLEIYGVPAAEIRFAHIGSDIERYKALAAGIVDAAVVSIEFSVIAPAHVRLLVPGRDVMPNFIHACVTTTGKIIAEQRQDAVRFVAAQIAALRYAVSHRDEEIALTREATKAKANDPRPGYVFDEVVRHGDIDPEMKIPVDKLEWMQAMLVKRSNIPHTIELSKLYDASIRSSALERIGR